MSNGFSSDKFIMDTKVEESSEQEPTFAVSSLFAFEFRMKESRFLMDAPGATVSDYVRDFEIGKWREELLDSKEWKEVIGKMTIPFQFKYGTLYYIDITCDMYIYKFIVFF